MFSWWEKNGAHMKLVSSLYDKQKYRGLESCVGVGVINGTGSAY